MKKILLMSLLAALLSACATYEQLPIAGQVIDAESGEPIAGAVVVGDWALEGGWYESVRVGTFERQEVVTNDNGEFVLPGWKPRSRPSGINAPYIPDHEPRIVAYRYGYLPVREFNNNGWKDKDSGILEWSGKEKISLTKLPEDYRARYELFSDKGGLAGGLLPPLFRNCTWKTNNLLLLEYDKQEYEFEIRVLEDIEGAPVIPWFSRALHRNQYVNKDYSINCPGVIEFLTSQRKKREMSDLKNKNAE